MTGAEYLLLRELISSPQWKAFEDVVDKEVVQLKDSITSHKTVEGLVGLKNKIEQTLLLKNIVREKIQEHEDAEKGKQNENLPG